VFFGVSLVHALVTAHQGLAGQWLGRRARRRERVAGGTVNA